MVFDKESEFEKTLITSLFNYGWDSHVLSNPTEEDLVRNWANILYENNRSKDSLGSFPLTDTEMHQVILAVNQLRTPIERNAFINNGIVTITRDNPDDTAHIGKPVTLRIFNRFHIAAGESHYQIAKQPRFYTDNQMHSNRRGDFMLLINGMPVIHVELKKSGIAVKQACYQIKKYAAEGIFSRGIYSLVQVFVAMTPDETLYFANPGEAENFQDEFFFHWADADNKQINDWQGIATHLLSIPMAHQLIGSYTVADQNDQKLKVMRSYQYYAASRVCDRVRRAKWGDNDIYGGYVWHTTGSGKTLTSFKAAQLIAMAKLADKVVFLVDRLELGTQSLEEFRGFADTMDDVQDTGDTAILVSKLKSNNDQDTLIVTSIQKMSRIKPESQKAADIKAINNKRLVIIIDEAHRDTFGEMMIQMRKTFTRAIYFGFTGTPVLDENNRLGHTSASIFGAELHRYSIADGIRDKNVLPFDPYKVTVYRDDDLRRQVALEQVHANSEAEALADENKKERYLRFMNEVPMAGNEEKKIKGIEDYIPNTQYSNPQYRTEVVRSIVEKFPVLSRARKFHAIFATSSIPEAFIYYDLFRERAPKLRITCLVDPSIDNTDGASIKEEQLSNIVSDYNSQYGTNYTMPTYGNFKKDITLRLAHKKQYKRIDGTDKTLDILIVVDQMLTGYDSKWVNTLYLDKVLRYERIIQAFSRTNRLFGNQEKPHGIIKYYRKPHTMEKYVEEALRLYSDEDRFHIFVDHLENNLQNINQSFLNIKHIFETADIQDFVCLPEEKAARSKFADEFKELCFRIESARLQGFDWNQDIYDFAGNPHRTIKVLLDEQTYEILLLRYKELFAGGGGGEGGDDIPYDIDTYLVEKSTGHIDTDYMNDRFTKYYRQLQQYGINGEGMTHALEELHREFAVLSQEQQHYAELFLHDVQNGCVEVDENKTLSDYITEYMTRAKDDRIHRCAQTFGLDEQQLRDIMASQPTEDKINQFNRYDDLFATIDRAKATEFIEKQEGYSVPPFLINPKVDGFLRRFILQGGFDI